MSTYITFKINSVHMCLCHAKIDPGYVLKKNRINKKVLKYNIGTLTA